jgi:hypothetical protein
MPKTYKGGIFGFFLAFTLCLPAMAATGGAAAEAPQKTDAVIAKATQEEEPAPERRRQRRQRQAESAE